MMRTTVGWRVGAALGILALVTAARADEPRLAEYFGFLPLEIYKLDSRIGGVLVRDLDGDKVGDVAVINNGRSRIDLLLTGPKEAQDQSSARAEANQVPSDRRMRLRSLPVNKEVVSLQAGDFDGDGRADLAYYGTPAELIVLFNQGRGQFGRPKRIAVSEAVETTSALTVGDLNRDGRDDLALLTAEELITVLQDDDGKLGDPQRLAHTAARPGILKAIDLDGDGGDDLVILDGSGDDPIRVRFATREGRLGPEQRFPVETPRAIAFGNFDGRPGAEVLTIENQSGRARVLTLAEGEEDESDRRGRLIFYPLPPGTARGRALALGDLDGDGRTDVVVTDPANAQFLVYRQAEGTGLGTGQTFPGLAGGKAVRLADFDGDQKAEVVVLSEPEKQIGRSVLADGRLSFPEALPLSGGDPVALQVADLDGDGRPELLYVARTTVKEADAYTLRALKREPAGPFVPFRWGPDDAVEVRGLTGPPPALRVLDVNRDGPADVLVFNAYGPPVLLLGRPGGAPPAPAGGSLGPLSGVSPAGLTVADVDGPALIVAQNTFARNLRLGADGQWQVKDQYNSGRGSAQVQGAAAIDTDGDGRKEIALLDQTSKALLFLDQKEGVYRPSGTLTVGPIDFQGFHVADLDSDGRDDLLLAGTEKFGVVLTGRTGLGLKALAGYESIREEARLTDLAAGDLNADGRMDIVLTDTTQHFIEIVTFAGQADLERGLAFKVFEQKSFHDVDDLIEPRDLAIGDVDGDGRSDLVLIVHDRVLVYRQDPGPDASGPAPTAGPGPTSGR